MFLLGGPLDASFLSGQAGSLLPIMKHGAKYICIELNRFQVESKNHRSYDITYATGTLFTH